MRTPLSVVVITRNEERNIERCLGSVAWAAEAIVVDSHSDDRTREKAAVLGARVIERDWPGFGAQKNFGIDQATSPWILSLDADEEVSSQLAAEIQRAIRGNSYLGYRVRWSLDFLGHTLRHYGRAPKEPGFIRLFRKDCGRFTEPVVHEKVTVNGPVAWLESPLIHHCYANPQLRSYWQKIHYYAPLEARLYAAAPPKPASRWIRAAGKAGWMLFVRRGILHGPSAWAWIGGAAYQEWLATGEAARLRKQDGLSFRVACLDQTSVIAGAELALENQIKQIGCSRWRWLVVLGEDGPLASRLRSQSAEVTVLRLPRSVRSLRQDAIRARSFGHPFRLAALAWYAIRLVRRLSSPRVNLIHINSMRMALLGGVAGKILRRPVVWQVHSAAAQPAMSPAAVRLTQLLARFAADHIICPSNAIAETLPGVPLRRLSVIPNGIDPAPYRPTRFAQHNRVAMVARLAPIKGQHVFLQAIESLGPRHPGVEFVIAGAPLFGAEEYAKTLKDQAAKLGGASVRFAGHIDDVPAFLDQIDIYIHASVTAEGLPLGLIEAMMAGKAIIATAAGGPSEMIDDGVTGRLIPPGDAQALAKALHELLNDAEGAWTMGHRAREVALERYDIRKTASMIERVYESVLARRKGNSFASA